MARSRIATSRPVDRAPIERRFTSVCHALAVSRPSGPAARERVRQRDPGDGLGVKRWPCSRRGSWRACRRPTQPTGIRARGRVRLFFEAMMTCSIGVRRLTRSAERCKATRESSGRGQGRENRAELAAAGIVGFGHERHQSQGGRSVRRAGDLSASAAVDAPAGSARLGIRSPPAGSASSE